MNIKLDIFSTMALATFVFYFGTYCKNKIQLFSKYCIPAPVIGGLIFSIIVLILKMTNIATITLDTTLQTVFMTAFFTSVGFTASVKMLKKGGIKVIIFLGLSILLVVFQNTLGVTLSKLFKLNPLLGLCTSSIAMVGGHGTAGSFGPLLEEMNVRGATTVSFASATFGLIMGSVIGGFVAKSLIERYNLKTPKISKDKSIPVSDFHEDNAAVLCHSRLMNAVSWIFFAMGIGCLISKFIQSMGLTFPSYIGAMMAAAIIRNICDFKNKKLEEKEIETIGGISLSVFSFHGSYGIEIMGVIRSCNSNGSYAYSTIYTYVFILLFHCF